jgi:single-stranded-DNA-specific exonuclease
MNSQLNNYKIIQGISSLIEIPEINKNEIRKLAEEMNISHAVASVLFSRGYTKKELANEFLFPNYEKEKYNPIKLEESEIAVERIIKAIKNNEKILICGDYDVDGISSTALLLYALILCKANVNFFLPNRIIDGYGLSKKTVDRALKNKYKLLITVDNGISAYEAASYAKENKIDLIITDHHQPGEKLPNAYCIINPHKKTCNYPFKELAGVGVIFKIVSLLFEKLEIKITGKIYELFLLGTVADMVPLIDENRFLVKHALRESQKLNSLPIKILKENAKIRENKTISSTDIGFSIAPQLNALGRLDDPRDGVIFLISKEEDQIINIGKKLLDLNIKRKKIEKDIFEDLKIKLKNETEEIKKRGLLIVSSETFQPGIVGLIASRLCNFYSVPTCVLHELPEEILKGSFRSIPACNIFEVLSENSDLLISFGGHSGAAGISIKKENLNNFKKKTSRSILKRCKSIDFQPKIHVDAILNVDEIGKKLWNDLILMEPFGSENQVPIFYLEKVGIKNLELMKDLHVKFKIQSGTSICSIIFFNRPEIYKIINENINKLFSVVAKLTENDWNEKKNIELLGIEIIID